MSNWNLKIKYNGKILKKMNKNCLGKYQNNKWSYMCMFNFFFRIDENFFWGFVVFSS